MKTIVVVALVAVIVCGVIAGRDAIRSTRNSVAVATRRID